MDAGEESKWTDEQEDARKRHGCQIAPFDNANVRFNDGENAMEIPWRILPRILPRGMPAGEAPAGELMGGGAWVALGAVGFHWAALDEFQRSQCSFSAVSVRVGWEVGSSTALSGQSVSTGLLWTSASALRAVSVRLISTGLL